MKDKARGFKYHIDPARIEAYRKWPLSLRLNWLLAGNKLRRSLPAKPRAIQEAFRQGKL